MGGVREWWSLCCLYGLVLCVCVWCSFLPSCSCAPAVCYSKREPNIKEYREKDLTTRSGAEEGSPWSVKFSWGAGAAVTHRGLRRTGGLPWSVKSSWGAGAAVTHRGL